MLLIPEENLLEPNMTLYVTKTFISELLLDLVIKNEGGVIINAEQAKLVFSVMFSLLK